MIDIPGACDRSPVGRDTAGDSPKVHRGRRGGSKIKSSSRLAGMLPRNRTYRVVDGERIEGTWRHVFIRNGDYFLTDLLVYADGAIWCWEWVDLDGLREKLRDGWVATTLEAEARASAHDLASWRLGDPASWITADELLGEV